MWSCLHPSMLHLKYMVKIWLRARAIVILGIRLGAFLLGLGLGYFFSHIIASLFITLVCFSNAWHKELSPTAFREWKRPRESVLAAVLLVLAISLYHVQVESNPTSSHLRHALLY